MTLDAARRLKRALGQLRKDAEGKLDALARLLESTSYQKVLARGYAVVHGPEGLLTNAAAIAPGTALELEFADGRAQAVASGVAASGAAASKAKPKARRDKTGNDDQGTLL